MNNSRTFLLGLLFIAALSILAFYTLFLTDIHIFSEPILKTVYFPEAYGLRQGDPVLVLGARIGRVKELEADTSAEPRRRIRTVLSLDKDIELLEGGSIIIRESTFLGGHHVDIDPGVFGGPPLPADADGAYYGEIRKNPIQMLADLGTLLNENRAAINTFVGNMEAITSDIRSGKGLLGRLVEDQELGDRAADVVKNLKAASDEMKDGQGLLGAMIYDPELKATVVDTFERFERVGADLEGQKGPLGALIYDSELRDKLVRGIDSFSSVGQKLDQGQGALGLLLSDEETRGEVKTLVANLKTASEDISALTAQVKGGQGSLGKLLADDGLYQEAQRAIGLFTRSLEDYREAAPITAFTAVLFAAF